MFKSLLLVGFVTLIISVALASASQITELQSNLVYRANDFATKQTFNFDWTFEQETQYDFGLTGDVYDSGLSERAVSVLVYSSSMGQLDLGDVYHGDAGSLWWTYKPQTQALTGNVMLCDYYNKPITTDSVESRYIVTLSIEVYQWKTLQPYGYLFYLGVSVAVIGGAIIAARILYPLLNPRLRTSSSMIRLDKKRISIQSRGTG